MENLTKSPISSRTSSGRKLSLRGSHKPSLKEESELARLPDDDEVTSATTTFQNNTGLTNVGMDPPKKEFFTYYYNQNNNVPAEGSTSASGTAGQNTSNSEAAAPTSTNAPTQQQQSQHYGIAAGQGDPRQMLGGFQYTSQNSSALLDQSSHPSSMVAYQGTATGGPAVGTFFQPPRRSTMGTNASRFNYMDHPYFTGIGSGGGLGPMPTTSQTGATGAATTGENVLSSTYNTFMMNFGGAPSIHTHTTLSAVYSKASPITVLWLLENYESGEGVSLPRCLLYSHYIYHCRGNGTNPVNAASFGKLIRSLFPNLKTRRLGTRDNEEYVQRMAPKSQNSTDSQISMNLVGPGMLTGSAHMIRTKQEASESIPSINIAFGDEDEDIDQERSLTQRTLSSFSVLEYSDCFPEEAVSQFGKVITQEFPTLSSLDVSLETTVPPHLRDKFHSFATNLLALVPKLDTQIFLQALDAHLRNLRSFISTSQEQGETIDELLEAEATLLYVAELEITVYQALVNRLFPKLFIPLPSRYVCRVRVFARKAERLVIEGSSTLPPGLRRVKMASVKAFGELIRHYTCLNHLFVGAVNSLRLSKHSSLADEIRRVNLEHITTRYSSVFNYRLNTEILEKATKNFADILKFEITDTTSYDQLRAMATQSKSNPTLPQPCFVLLEQDKPKTPAIMRLQALMEWVFHLKYDIMNEKAILAKSIPEFYELYCKFLSSFNHFLVSFVRELTLQGTTVFGLVHILHLLLSEYLVYLLEYDMFTKFGILPLRLYFKVECRTLRKAT